VAVTAIALRLLGRYWPHLLAAIAIAFVVGWVWNWLADKDRQIAAAQAQTRVAYGRQAATVQWAGQLQVNWMIETGNRVRALEALDRQSAAVRAQADAGQRATQAAAEGLRRAQGIHAADEARIAALNRPVAGSTACERAENRRAAVLEALR
jgi:hypothetical protein